MFNVLSIGAVWGFLVFVWQQGNGSGDIFDIEPTGAPNVLPGHVELVVPDLGALRERLEEVRSKLAGTEFAFANEDKHIRVTCPWGNTFRCFAPAPEFGDVTLGLARVEVPVRPGTAAGIARFYQTVFNAPGIVAASCCAPPIPPRPAVRIHVSPRSPP